MDSHDIKEAKIMKYYTDTENIDNMLAIINGNSKLSLRVVDWFVTNYSQKHKTVYNIRKNNPFFVQIDYKSQLNAWHKERFDPFCRRERLDIEINGHHLNTTIGQLNFFKWVINNNIIDYIEESDDEEDFQDVNPFKYVDVNKELHMIFEFNHKFKRWCPTGIARQGDRIIHIGKLVYNYNT